MLRSFPGKCRYRDASVGPDLPPSLGKTYRLFPLLVFRVTKTNENVVPLLPYACVLHKKSSHHDAVTWRARVRTWLWSAWKTIDGDSHQSSSEEELSPERLSCPRERTSQLFAGGVARGVRGRDPRPRGAALARLRARRRGQAPDVRGHDTSLFSRLVLGCIETKFCNQIRIFSGFSRSTKLSS